MKSGIKVLLAIVAVLVFCNACGNNPQTGSSEQQTTAATATTAAAAATSQSSMEDEAGDNDLPLLEITALWWYSDFKQAPNDVVTPYVEEKFNIKINDFIPSSDQSFQERFNLWAAADNIPDLISAGKSDVEYAIASGRMADLTPYIDGMTNWNKYFDHTFYQRVLIDGKMMQIPQPYINTDAPEHASDPYNPGFGTHCLKVREDMLIKAGYKFKTLAQMDAEMKATGVKPSEEDYALDPPINTPDDFYEMLRRIKDLEETVEGRDIIPLSMPAWNQFHVGNMFDFGHWGLGDDGLAHGFLGSVEAKDWYRYLTRIYREGLLDKDFLIQKDDQLQTKFAIGQAVCGMYIPDLGSVQTELLNKNPEAVLRVIKWPKQHPDKGFFDIYESGFWRVVINNDTPDIKRLIDYLDWTLSDEGLDILTWGPESAGLWKMEDGKKVFVDDNLRDAMLASQDNILLDNGPTHYGLFTLEPFKEPEYYSRAGAMSLGSMLKLNPMSYARSYPPNISITLLNNSLSANGMNFDGRASYGDGSDVVNDVSNYYWSKFTTTDVAKLLVTESDAEFDAAWDIIYDNFIEETNYLQAQQNMTEWFKINYTN